ncbi:MAG TPA: DUF262 domain-containing protein [Methanothrix sp.]|jgi:hypothetical protein|nr:DUF262 domain-containing protein [Methanothrix sp.]
MNLKKTFQSPDLPLSSLLDDIKRGKIQVPEFQRDWKWDDDHIKSILASVSLSYPVGAVMMLETGNENVRFEPRPIDGVENPEIGCPDFLILDGQQRLTALFQALYSQKPAKTKDVRGKEIKRWYYINIEHAIKLNNDREDAIVGLPEDKVIRNFRNEVISDYSTAEKEYEAGLFPLNNVFDSSDWRRGFNEYFDHNQEKSKLWDKFEGEVVKRFEQYQIPVIQLTKETPKDAVCQVFEKVNTKGVSLNVFELLTATFAADEFILRKDWSLRKDRLKKKKLLAKIENTEFLQAVTLLATWQNRNTCINSGQAAENAPPVSCKRKDILNLSLADYQKWADPVIEGFERAAKFLHTQKIFSARDIPYSTQLIPMAAILAVLGDEADKEGIRAKLSRWFWCGVLGELYGSAIETRFARDLSEFLTWIDGGAEPITVYDAGFNPSRLFTLRTRNSAAYKGILAILIRGGALDLRTGYSIDEQSYFDEKIDIHHIFPQDWCSSNGIEQERCNCIINKTPISAKTNRIIGGTAPSDYLTHMERNAGISSDHMDEILTTHSIDPDFMRSDDFDGFFKTREEALIKLVEQAMGKPVVRGIPMIDIDDDYHEESD